MKKVLLIVLVLMFALSVLYFEIPGSVEGTEVIDTDTTWHGNKLIDTTEDVLVVNCTLTIADGNVTVLGNLTFQNAVIDAELTTTSRSLFFVSSHGNLTMHNTTMTYSFQIVSSDIAKVEIYDSTVWDIESRNTSKVRVIRSTVNSSIALDDSIQDYMFTWIAVNSVGCGLGWCPRLSFYNCTVPAIEATNTTLEIAHTTITTLKTHNNVWIKFDNMSIADSWSHEGILNWIAINSVGWGLGWSIEWGIPKASGTFKTYSFTADRLREASVPPSPPPAHRQSIGTYVNISGQVLSPPYDLYNLVRIHYTDEQVATIKVSSLRLYVCSEQNLTWQPLDVTGVNNTGRYVWGDLNTTTSYVQLYFAAFGRYLTDINGDGKIDIKDIAIVAKAYGSYPGHERWNPDADIDENGKIDIKDVARVAKDFGKIYWIT